MCIFSLKIFPLSQFQGFSDSVEEIVSIMDNVKREVYIQGKYYSLDELQNMLIEMLKVLVLSIKENKKKRRVRTMSTPKDFTIAMEFSTGDLTYLDPIEGH